MSASGASTAERGPTQTRASPLAQPQPLVVALALAERRVQHRDDVAEPGAEPRQRLRRQARSRGRARSRRARPRASPATARRYTSVLPEPVTPCNSRPPPSSGPWRWASAARTSSSARCWEPVSAGGDADCAADVDPGRAPRLGRERELDQAASLQTAQRGRAQRCGHGRPAGSELRQQAALAVVEAHLAGQCLTAGVGQLGDQHPLGRDAVCGPGREHQPQRPGDRRAVLARHPAGERDQVGRQSRREAPRRARSAARARARSCRPSRRPPRACAGGRTGPSAAIPPRRPADLRAAGSRTDRGSRACG